jgi:hypothetical protein
MKKLFVFIFLFYGFSLNAQLIGVDTLIFTNADTTETVDTTRVIEKKEQFWYPSGQDTTNQLNYRNTFNWEVIGDIPFAFNKGTGTYSVNEQTTDDYILPIMVRDKYLNCDAEGSISFQSNQSYGTWEFNLYKGSGSTNVNINFISNAISVDDGYMISFNSNEAISLERITNGVSVSVLSVTANSYISINTWYRIKITRSLENIFYIYIKGGSFGNTYQLVDVSGGSGSNPSTNSVYTTSNYTLLDFDSSDKIGDIVYKKGIEYTPPEGTYNIYAQILFNRMSADLSIDYKNAIDEFIDTLTRTGQYIWDNLSFLHVYLSGQNKADALLDFIGNYDGTELGALTYKSKLGLVGGDVGDAVNTNFTPQEDSTLYKLRSCNWGYYLTEGVGYGNYFDFGVAKTNMYTGGYAWQAATFARHYTNGVNNPFIITVDTGLFAGTITGTTNTFYINDNSETDPDAVIALPDVPFYSCAGRGELAVVDESPRTIGAGWAGAYLTSDEIQIIRRAIIRLKARLATVDYAENLIYRTSDILYIASKFDDTRDIVIRYSELNLNEVTTFTNVTLNDNSESYISTDITADDNPINRTVSSDNIGPINVLGLTWIGGGHGWDQDHYDLLEENYTANDTIMELDSTYNWVSTGGWARHYSLATGNTYFKYTAKNDTSIYGLTGFTSSILAGDSVRIFPATAATTELSFKIDGIEIDSGYFYYADSVNVTVRNTMWDMNTLDRATGLSDTLYYEDVNYVIRNGQIKTSVSIEPLSNFTATLYYGMQSVFDNFQDSLYFASDSSYNIWEVGNLNANSGFYTNYPCNRAVLSNIDKTINQSMYVDSISTIGINVGLPSDRSLASDRAMFINPNFKTYNNFVYGLPRPMDSDSTYNWLGYYNWFNNDDYLVNGNFTYAYPEWHNDSLIFFVDTHNATSDYIDVSNWNYTSYEVIENTGIVFGTMRNNMIPVSSTGYARAKLYLK